MSVPVRAWLTLTAMVIALTVVWLAYSRERAVQTAVGLARLPHLVLLGEPHSVNARLTTLRDAVISSVGEEDLQYTPGFQLAPVWVVDVAGTYQLQGGPEPTPQPALGTAASNSIDPTPAPFEGNCAIIVEFSGVGGFKACRTK